MPLIANGLLALTRWYFVGFCGHFYILTGLPTYLASLCSFTHKASTVIVSTKCSQNSNLCSKWGHHFIVVGKSLHVSVTPRAMLAGVLCSW